MPRPFSVNNMYRNSGKGRNLTRKYERWRDTAMQTVMAQGPRRAFLGPVEITIRIGAEGVSTEIDTDNCAKAYLDVLVKLGVLPDDNRRIVKRLVLEWMNTAEGAEIEVKRWE